MNTIMKLQRNITFGLTAMISSALFSQSTSQALNTMELGIRISPNIAWAKIQSGSMKANGAGVGFTYGITGDFALGNSGNYFFSTELNVSTIPVKVTSTTILKNVNSKGTVDSFKGGELDFNYSNQYLQIPLGLKMKTAEVGNMKYYIQVGIAPSFLMKSRLTTSPIETDKRVYPEEKGISFHDPNSSDDNIYEFSGTKVSGSGVGETVYDFKDDVTRFRFPAIIGVGLDYKLTGNTRFTAGLRFDNSINDFFKDKRVNARSNMIAINLGIIF
jgi:hypothetical protein